jgi:antitoxin component YwqK of YwqJK toxin-antitoxin module
MFNYFCVNTKRIKMMVRIITALMLAALLATPAICQTRDSINQYDQQGRKHGVWVKTYPNGQKKYRGRFEHGEPAGTFKRYFPGGKTMAVMNHSHPRGVYARLFNKKGQKRAEGLYIKQKKDSTWVFYNNRGQVIMREQYHKGKRHGQSVKFFANGDTSHITSWQDGVRHGVYKQFFPNGRLKLRASYQKGQLEGPFTIYFPEGFKEIVGSYKNNLRHGKWVYFNNAADTARVLRYENGEPLNEEALELKEHKEIKRLENNQGKFGDPRKEAMPDRWRRRR